MTCKLIQHKSSLNKVAQNQILTLISLAVLIFFCTFATKYSAPKYTEKYVEK